MSRPKSQVKTVETLDSENVLQAVIIVDTFSQKLSPFCDHMPSSLIPLANRPILDYTLECLVSSGVQEAIVFCSSFADQVKDFLRKDKWPGLSITIVVSEGCRTFGDVMRDLDAKALIRSDFILLTGNVVGNMLLLPILEKHKRIQKVDKGAVMTLIFKECGRRQRSAEDDFAVALDSKTNRVLLYSKKSKSPAKIDIPLEVVLERAEVDIRCDLIDTQVAVCTIAVPPLFSDNFDFQTRDDLVRGILVDEEVMASTVYGCFLPQGQYAACATAWPNYQDITHDVIHRWTYPLVPDMFPENPYTFRRNNIYTQHKVTLSQGCKLEEDVVMAKGSSVGQDSTISRTVIGENCKIGNNVIISDSYIMDNVTIHDDCRVSQSVVGPGVTLHKACSVTLGSVLGAGVVIDAGKSISAFKLQAQPSAQCDSEDKICSKAYLYTSNLEEDSDSDSETNEAVSGLRVKDEEFDDELEDSSDSDDEITRSLSPMPEDTNLFYSEVVDSLVRGYDDRLPCDNLVLEINSSRYAYNVSMSEVNVHVVRALLTLVPPGESSWQLLSARLTYFTPILTNYIRSPQAQSDCLEGLEDVAGSHPKILALAMKIFNWLYDKDILSEQAILDWYSNPSQDSDPTISKTVRDQVTPFIMWLKEAEEQSSDSEDEEESDSDDED